MITTKLDYFTLLSYEPVNIPKVGSVKSPLLKEIAKITFSAYSLFLNFLSMDIDSYFRSIDGINEEYYKLYATDELSLLKKVKEEYWNLSPEERKTLSFWDLAQLDQMTLGTIMAALQFFFVDEIKYDPRQSAFLLYNGTENDEKEKLVTGWINRENYNEVIHIILQLNGISKNDPASQPVKIKNKTAEKLLSRMEQAKKTKDSRDKGKMELPNLISALASRHSSINMTNIWDLTVYQLYDQFKRQRYLDSYEIQSMNVAAWGDSDGNFKETLWFEPIDD
ncbi:hypothetical protein GPL15_20435 [Clostridium sp. MCC353]|uniref:hypothetical protein n=1 Tax=Clostridium sp. MCC353 TaxID=2592646 RepID=UPI001C00F8FA|nr:hypothetical protein [Clostridium sp. MCC353]MBT9778851.1 hypothetical protein [Clostridium sp. MCC353]